MNTELLAAKARQRRIQALMRLPVPYRIRLQAVLLAGMKD